MLYKKIKHPNYNLFNIKTSKFKNCIIEINFQKEIKEHELADRILLAEVMNYNCKKYPTKSKLSIRKQELYDVSITCYASRLGNVINTSFSCGFIAPKYIKEDDYLEEIIKLLMDVLFDPNVTNNAFDLTTLDIIKNNILTEIEDGNEDPNRVAISNVLRLAFPNSVSHYGIVDEKEYIEDMTADELYNVYEKMLKNDSVNIFTIGDLDSTKVDDLIHKYFKSNIINNEKYNLRVENSTRRKVLVKEDNSKFIQTQLLMLYNINKFPKDLREVVPYIFNNLFGNGSLNSKLTKYLREDNSLCYGVSCMFFKFDDLLLIKVALAKENINKAIKLIKKAVKEMQNDDFSLNEFNDAKKSACFSIKIAQDNIHSVLNNYVFNYYDDFSLPNDRLKKVKSITPDDISRFAKCLKLNTIYILNEGGSDERNNN